MSLYQYRAKVVRIVDGDTIDVDLDLGFEIHYKVRIRFLGINAPESRTRDLEEKALGLAAKDFVSRWLLESAGNHPVIETSLDKKGKYGRVLGRILNDEGVCLNDVLIEEGHATPYDGGKR
jgi:micrococcal nuclease